ncbi:AAA family ATPase [Clostridium sp. C8-1-8]|uniref:AAA family ATPase n=1 Tax=Clostridium sp. C8-1-8 TaxID=2698831 RepID=UPI00136E5F98|nr:AAA family ATPase [Clostridium sp. C8-1-8]
MELFSRKAKSPKKLEAKIWPSNFENKDFFSKEEKEIMRFVKSNIEDGNFVAGVNPVGEGIINKISYYFSRNTGLMTFLIINREKESVVSGMEMLETVSTSLEKHIMNRLLDSKVLFMKESDKKFLKIPYNHYVVLQNVNLTTLKKKEKEFFRQYENKLLFKNLTTINNKDIIAESKYNIAGSDYQLSEIEEKSIIERLSPEYSVIIPEKYDEDTIERVPAKKINTRSFSLDITGKEIEYKTFALDDEQVELINDLSLGHRLILANPGAGKSVVLLSKAFKVCKLYPDSEVLVTCYNSNLAESYGFRAACSGFNEGKKLHISTFHKFILNLTRDTLGLRLSINEFDKALDVLEQAIDNGKIKLRFRAIFIDEVQIFEPRWLDICYKLINANEEHIFLLAGDLNQDLRNMSKKGKAVWQLAKLIPSNFRGRVKYLNKNYRNTREICSYINTQLEFMNTKTEQIGVNVTKEFDINTFGITDRQGIPVTVKRINKFDFQKEVIMSVKEIHKKYNVDYSDIAIIFPYKLQPVLKYYPLAWIRSGLDKEGIYYKIICPDGKNPKEKYIGGDGVVLTTVDSALGLDFRAVIVAAIYPLSYINRDYKFIEITEWNMLNNFSEEEKEAYLNGLRKIYTASSRAREILYVLSEVREKLPIDEFIKPKE